MVEKYISSVHIEKLGHTIQEIRERALKNIVSKLDSGFEFDNDLVRSREILQKLFEWFYFSECSCETIVLTLIKDILQTESGKTLIKCYGNEKILKELKQIYNHVKPDHYSLINNIIDYVKKHEEKKEVVPPLESDIPLSYRSEEYYLPFAKMKTAETTASTIVGLVEGSSLNEQQTGIEHNIEDLNSLKFVSNKPVNDIWSYMPHYTLCWYPLINTDQHVLESVENSLINPIEPSALLHTFDFFTNVMLHDFPAEVFLQRPHILQELQKLISTCTSSRIKAAVLTALIKFTKLLNIRINYYSDPCTHNLKQFFLFSSHSNLSSPVQTTLHSNRTSIRSFSNSEIDKFEATNILKPKQIPIPLFCLNTITCILDYLYTKPSNIRDIAQKKKWTVCNIKALLLLNNLVDLLALCLSKKIWDCRADVVADDVIKILREIFIKFGDIIEYIRLETISNDFEMTTRFIHISLLNICLKFLSLTVPEEKINIILPRNLKNVITYSLLDSSISRLYPGIHENLLKLTKEFIGRYENDTFSKYQDIKAICKSMSSAIKFLKNYKSLPFHDSILLVKASLKSLDFHKKYTFIKIFVELCANKLPIYIHNINTRENITEIVLELLNHPDAKIRKEMYRLCAKHVIAAIGPKLNNNKTGAPGSQILFLLDSPILNEITLHGLSSCDTEIQKLSEDILVPILKCKILVSNEIWNSVIEALILTFPALLCYVDKSSLIGRTVMRFLDPDKAEEMNLTKLEILKSNSCLLFIEDAAIREEAVSRLCWLLASQGDNKDLLPRINSLFDKSLSMCCQIKHVYDVNREYNAQHYYQPSSLQQLLELLNSSNVEPVIRRSALTQISVMMEDSIMHNTFIERNGFGMIIEIMKSALDESDYRNYPDSIIPAVSILKSICLYSASFRQQLCTDLDLYYLLLRGLFLFCTEERMKHEGCTLLFLLLYNHFLKGSPSKCDFGLPKIVVEKLNIPFICHANISKNQDENKLTDILLQDKYCLQSLRIHWNSQWFQGFNELLRWNEICYQSTDDFNNVLRLSNADLFEIQSSSLEFCMNSCLKVLQNATSHQDVIDSLVKLIGYVNLYKTMKYNFIFESDILTLSWKETFSRFLNTIPASDEDNELLQYILEFLGIIIPLYKEKGADCWISDFLKNHTNSFLTLLSSDNNQDNETKAVNRELLTLITACVYSEHHYLDFYGPNISNSLAWSYAIEVIASNLKFNDTQHFYNLAYLDSTLSCLVHLTASIGWTKAKHEFNSKSLLVQLVTGLCEMIGAFHCGKGASAANSVMGLSITRHAVLILNHLLVEMQQCNIKDWESLFIEEESGIEDIFYNLMSLWNSRDVILRAGTFQLFAGLATSHRCAVEIIQCYKRKRGFDVWEVILNMLLDHEESSIVRENVANMLINLISHTSIITRDELTLDITPTTSSQVTNTISEVLNLLNDLNFYKELEVCINCLYIENKFFINEDEIIKLLEDRNSSRNEKYIYTFTKRTACTKESECSASTNDNGIFAITTPGLIKSLSVFLYNLIGLAPVEIITQLQNHGIIKLLFRSLFIPDIEIKSTKDLSLYCDILEMNRAICRFLGRAVSNSELCFNTILNTRDCLNILISLLNINIFNSEFSQLIYLRNKLWTEIFTLLSALLNYEDIKNENVRITNKDALQIISTALSENGNEFFLQTLCESINTYNSTDLQNSALNSLTSLLKTEIAIKENATLEIKSRSIQDLLDGTYTPRTTVSSQDNKENFSPNNNYKLSPKNISSSERAPEQFYLGSLNNITKNATFKQFEKESKESNFVIAGAELCRILLYILNVASVRSSTNNKRKSLILNSLTNILCVSQEAKKYALNNGLLDVIIKQIREIHIKLTLESVESLRRVSDKKRIMPFLQEITVLIRLLMNFMVADISVKNSASTAGLSDLIHKLWIWILHQKNLLVDALKMLCTYTIHCQPACQSLTLTSPVAGSGPRRVPSNISLLHAIIMLISKEMDQISRTHDLLVLKLSFQLLQNSCLSPECRIILSKSNLLQSLTKLHPAITKKQKPWEIVELIWLEFLELFSRHPEGQLSIAKVMDVLDLIIILTNSSKISNASTALMVLRNISFYSSNRPRLLTCGDFLNMLGNKLISSNISDKNVVVTIIWALAANNQKAKLMLKCAGLETKLQETLKILHLSTEYEIDPKELDQMHYVLNMLRDSDK